MISIPKNNFFSDFVDDYVNDTLDRNIVQEDYYPDEDEFEELYPIEDYPHLYPAEEPKTVSWQDTAFDSYKQLSRADLIRELQRFNNPNEYKPSNVLELQAWVSNNLTNYQIVQLLDLHNRKGSKSMYEKINSLMLDQGYLDAFDEEEEPTYDEQYNEREEEHSDWVAETVAEFNYISERVDREGFKWMRKHEIKLIGRFLEDIMNPHGQYPFKPYEYMTYYGNIGINIPHNYIINQVETDRAWKGYENSLFFPLMGVAEKFGFYKKITSTYEEGHQGGLFNLRRGVYDKSMWRGKFVIITPELWFPDNSVSDIDKLQDVLLNDLYYLRIKKVKSGIWETAEGGYAIFSGYKSFTFASLIEEAVLALEYLKDATWSIPWPILPNLPFVGTIHEYFIKNNWAAIKEIFGAFK